MLKFIRSLFCRHRNVHFVRNVYGDEINHLGGKRSVWRCQDCASTVYRDDLHTLLPQPACPHRDEPRGCYRVRCQLGRKCAGPEPSCATEDVPFLF